MAFTKYSWRQNQLLRALGQLLRSAVVVCCVNKVESNKSRTITLRDSAVLAAVDFQKGKGTLEHCAARDFLSQPGVLPCLQVSHQWC